MVHGTSLPDVEALPIRGTRLATLLLVADGVGGAVAGNDAARVATEAVMRYVAGTLRSYHTAGDSSDDDFLQALRDAALQAHDAVRAEAAARADNMKMATTLTLGIAVWPWFYAVQVGDSRCYVLIDGSLHQITRDQTIAQSLVDQGLLTPIASAWRRRRTDGRSAAMRRCPKSRASGSTASASCSSAATVSRNTSRTARSSRISVPLRHPNR